MPISRSGHVLTYTWSAHRAQDISGSAFKPSPASTAIFGAAASATTVKRVVLVPLAAATTRYTSPAQSYATTDGLEAGGLSAAEGTAAVLLLPAAKEWIPAAALGERPPAPKRGKPPGASLPLEGGFDQLWPTGGLGRTGVDQLCPAGRRAGVTRALPAYSRKSALSGPAECRVLVQVGQ